MLRCLVVGLVAWLIGTAMIRLGGQYLLRPGELLPLALLLLASFPLMALLARSVCRGSALPPQLWPAGAILLVLPTMLLDTFSSAFFPLVYPNLPEQAAGLFAGWMLWSCAGALVGAGLGRA